MNIIHISDLHVGEETEFTHNIDTRKNLTTLLSHIKKHEFDVLVIGGDLAYSTGSKTIYSYIAQQLETIHQQVFIIAGNHDNKQLLFQTFSHAILDKHLYYTTMVEEKKLIFLDSSNGFIDNKQLSWLTQELQGEKDCIIFMHHPPLFANVPHMDKKYPLQNRDELTHIFHSHPYPLTIYCGHYHCAKTIQSKNITVHICPSNFYQIDDNSQLFKIANTNIGFQKISIHKKTIHTSIEWICTHT